MKATILTDDLKRLINSTKQFIGTDDRRPMLQWVELSFDKETMKATAVATNGFAMSVETAKCVELDENFKVYTRPHLPVKAKFMFATIELADKRLIIDIGGRIGGDAQLVGEYLDWKTIIEGFEKGSVVVDDVLVNRVLLKKAVDSIPASEMRKPVMVQTRNNLNPLVIKTEYGNRYILPCRKKSVG